MPDFDLFERLRRVDAASLADAGLRVLPPEIRPLTPGARLVCRAVTADTGEDLMGVLGALLRCGPGDALVVATGGSRRAVAGELFATEAVRRGVAGLVIDGYCRDLATLRELPLAIFARGVTPGAAPAQAVPVVGGPVRVGDIEIRPGDILVGDDDGVVVGAVAEIEAAVTVAQAIHVREQALRRSMAEGGVSLFDRLNFAEHAARRRRGEESSLTFG